MTTHWLSSFSQNVIQPVAPAILNHLWQSTAFAAAVWLTTLLLRRNQARIRYALWMAASLKLLIPFALLIALGGLLPSPRHASAPAVVSAIDLAGQPFSEFTPPPIPFQADASSLRERIVEALPLTLAAIWLCGAATILLVWAKRLRQVAAIRRRALPIATGREAGLLREVERAIANRTRHPRSPVPLLLSQERMEPGIFGIFRPALVWPERLSARLANEHIEAVFAHELMHVRRRDNLTAALHMLIEAIFWFHPLIWGIEGRLIEERERACDEAVLHLGSHPEIYAEGLLKAVRFCVESPLPCVAGISGADLSRRVRSIMTMQMQKLNLTRKLCLGALACFAIAGPVALGVVQIIPTFGQILHATGPLPSFAVISIRPNSSDTEPGGIEVLPDGIATPHGTTLKVFIMWAYNVAGDSQFSGGPGWIRSTQFNIQAKVDEAEVVRLSKLPPGEREGQMRLMAQSLLKDRFKLKAGFVKKEQAVYELTVAKGGLKCPKAVMPSGFNAAKPSFSPPPPPPPPPPPSPEVSRTAAIARQVHLKAAPMWFLASLLSHEQEVDGDIVLDKTGVDDTYSIDLTWSRYNAVDPGPSLFTALQEQLGIKLTPAHGQVEVIVVDHVEMPSGQDQTESTAPLPSNQPTLSAVPSSSLLRVAQTSTKPAGAPNPQPTQPAPAPFAFEVSTVKLNNSGSDLGSHTGLDHDRYTATNVLLKTLMHYSAYGIPKPRILGGPKWLDSQHFDIEAKIDPTTLDRLKALPSDQGKRAMQAMFQQLLADRFHLAVHWETRDLPVYNLVVANKNGPTLPAAKDPNHSGTSAGNGQLQCVGCTLPEIAQVLTQEAQGELSRVVIDKTGIAGKYDIRLKWIPDPGPSSPDPSVAPLSIFTAIQEQLGLKLEPAHGPVKVLVIDRAEQPSEN